MSDSLMALCKAISPLVGLFSVVFFHIGILAGLAYQDLLAPRPQRGFGYICKSSPFAVAHPSVLFLSVAHNLYGDRFVPQCNL